ncbi:DUF3606 domain-containing protein [Novosphingobium sp. G106]|uniref:DUF3606 domain-containing protein n=1 Tax=Novosphingobium sp. G106 TaxID=2849500 RepID=UPI001C2D8848|nr:DUF3606 domain-containing protein [Novosphingobium sp. G106]MBV1692282.1 DUF3606 domain-containing protein [Novosphingobium sp. G106]
MVSDTTKPGRDRQFVAGGEGHELRHFTEKLGLLVTQAQELIDRVGNSREARNAAAQLLKG